MLPTVPPSPQFTLYHFWGYSYGKAAFLLARLAGTADLFIVPISQLALKVGGWCCLGPAGWHTHTLVPPGGAHALARNLSGGPDALNGAAEKGRLNGWPAEPSRGGPTLAPLLPIPQSFAERGALGSPAARALNLGMLLAALIHTGVELRMMAGGLGAWFKTRLLVNCPPVCGV